MEKAEILCAFLALAILDKVCFQASQAPATSGRAWGSSVKPTSEKDQIMDHTYKSDVEKSVTPGGLDPRMVIEAANLIARLLSMTFETLC